MNSASAMNQRLRLLKDIGRLPHALMFSGDESENLLSFAKDLVRYVLCPDRSREGACLECPSCRKFDQGVHPDFLLIEAEKKEIKIDQIRSAIQWIQIRPNESEEKFCVVLRAETLNRSAANSFLKTLEEPPPHAKIILLSRMSDHLLPTIRSRVQVFRFPSSTDASKEARGFKPDWMPELDLLLSEKRTASEIFDLTSNVPNERDALLAFFERIQREVLERMRNGSDLATPHFRKLEELHDLALRLEGQLLRGYGNLGLALDRWLLDWSLFQESSLE